jgi:hypothetical protein
MNPHLTVAVAAERRRDLERAAGCCTAPAAHRRTVARAVHRRPTIPSVPLRPTAQSPGCCV